MKRDKCISCKYFDKSDKLTSNTGAYDILEIINEAKEE